MAKVSFYILDSEQEARRIGLLCRLVLKAYDEGQQAWLYFSSEALMQRVDQALWMVAPESFIPHAITAFGMQEDPVDPVVLSMEPPRVHSRPLLFNLSETLPEFAQGYERVIEVIPQIDSLLAKGRARFKAYRALGFEVESHAL